MLAIRLSAGIRAAKGRSGCRRDPYIMLPRLCYDGVLSMRTREAMMGVMMGAKYSAEWWEKIAGLNREISAREDPSSVTDDLIQATAGARRSPARTSETPPLEAAPGGDLRKIKTDRFFYR